MGRWNRERIIREILSCEKDQRPLDSSAGEKGVDRNLYQAATRLFGSWRNAVAAAGLPTSQSRRHREWTPGRIIRCIRSLARQPKRLCADEVLERYGRLVPAARRYFGSWSKALMAAGVTTGRTRDTQVWTESRIIEEILTRVIRGESLDQARISPRTLVKAGIAMFGSWDDALLAAGIESARDPSTESPTANITPPPVQLLEERPKGVLDEHEHRPGTRWSEREITTALLRRYRSGASLSTRIVQREYRPLYRAARAVYGNWHNALYAAGLAGEDVRKDSISSFNRPQV